MQEPISQEQQEDIWMEELMEQLERDAEYQEHQRELFLAMDADFELTIN